MEFIILILSVLSCFVAVYMTYISINIYDDNMHKTFIDKFKNVPLSTKTAFIFNIFCCVVVVGIFLYHLNKIFNFYG